MADRRLAQIMARLRQASGAARAKLTAAYLAEGVVAILGRQRLAGEVLLQLPRQVSTNAPGALALTWDDDQLVLAANPSALATTTPDQLVALLLHEAYHVVWRHPLRYAADADQANVKAACDIAVNQYLPDPPRGTATLQDLRRLLRQPVKSGQDSADYLNLLRDHRLNLNGQLEQPGQHLNGPHEPTSRSREQPGQATLVPLDSHQGWLSSDDDRGRLKLRRDAQLQRLLSQAWKKTPAKQRGLLPGSIQRALQSSRQPRAPRWVRQLRLWLGTVPRGKRDSRARFNRRQPYRMELPGQVTRYVSRLYVFLDNSGSMGDDEISQLLGQINTLAQRRSTAVTVIPFDAAVHPEGIQQLTTTSRIAYQRSGGGGTRFQAIFDYLKDNRLPKESLVLIMTDGWGEATVQTFGYHNVVWLLTTGRNELSINNPGPRVIEIKGVTNND